MIKKNPLVIKLIDKIKNKYRIKSDAVLERMFNLKKRTLNNWRRSNSIPHELRLICIRNNIDLDENGIFNNEVPCLEEDITKYLGDFLFERIRSGYGIHKELKGKERIKADTLLDQWLKFIEDNETKKTERKPQRC